MRVKRGTMVFLCQDIKKGKGLLGSRYKASLGQNLIRITKILIRKHRKVKFYNRVMPPQYIT
jgi:hypothetical protein